MQLAYKFRSDFYFPGNRGGRREGRLVCRSVGSWKVMLIFIFVYLLPHRTPILGRCHALVVVVVVIIAERASESHFLLWSHLRVQEHIPWIPSWDHHRGTPGFLSIMICTQFSIWVLFPASLASWLWGPHPSLLSTSSCSEFVFSILTCLFCSAAVHSLNQ